MLCFSLAWLGTMAPERAVPGGCSGGSGCSGASSGVFRGCSGLLKPLCFCDYFGGYLVVVGVCVGV